MCMMILCVNETLVFSLHQRGDTSLSTGRGALRTLSSPLRRFIQQGLRPNHMAEESAESEVETLKCENHQNVRNVQKCRNERNQLLFEDKLGGTVEQWN